MIITFKCLLMELVNISIYFSHIIIKDAIYFNESWLVGWLSITKHSDIQAFTHSYIYYILCSKITTTKGNPKVHHHQRRHHHQQQQQYQPAATKTTVRYLEKKSKVLLQWQRASERAS